MGEASLRPEQEVEPPEGLPGPTASVLAQGVAPTHPQTHCWWAAGLTELGQAALRTSSPPFFPHMVSFQPTLKRPGNVCLETPGTLG